MFLLPPQDKRQQFKFYVLKKVSYDTRLTLIFVLLSAGILVELFYSFAVGVFILFAASAMGALRGVDVRQPLKRQRHIWHRVTPDEYAKIDQKAEDLARWDRDFFDITNLLGRLVGILLGIAVLAAAWQIYKIFGGKYAAYWIINFLAVLLVHWITGTRQYRKHDKLLLKAKKMSEISFHFQEEDRIHIIPVLATRQTTVGKIIPVDAKLLVKVLDAPPHFLGMQIKSKINVVRGKKFPYVYCVFVAKKGSGLFKKMRPPSAKFIFQKIKNPNADILVIKQNPRVFKGYHTRKNTAFKLTETALAAARRLANSV
jgi:hypothetical protein